jgi:predicted acyltransferase
MSATAARPGTDGGAAVDAAGRAPERPPERAAGAPARERLISLDVFRGMTVAGMLLVNNPGTWSAIYPPLEHAEWHGWTPTDLIFPFFLFIVGITTELSLGARRAKGDPEGRIVRQVLRRGALIFLFGLLLSWFPGFQWGTVAGDADPSFGTRVLYRLEHLRIMGVLQRIGLAYAIAGLITLRTTLRQQLAIVAALLLGYWVAMTLVPVPDSGLPGAQVLHLPGRTLDAWIDRVVLTADHLWAGGGGLRDPEGLFSTLPAVATVMLGNFAGRWIGRRELGIHERLSGLFAAGALGMVVGLVWHWAFPINKSLWTSSYVVFTGGMACVALATCMWVVDVHRVRWWTKPFVIYGVNPMIAFLGSGLMARLIYSVLKVQFEGKEVSLQSAIFQSAYASWLSPVNASLAFALSFVLLWLAILTVLYRRNIFLKV